MGRGRDGKRLRRSGTRGGARGGGHGPQAYVPPGFVLEGVLQGRGRLAVAGEVRGEVRLQGDVEVLAGGLLDGELWARRVRVEGLVRGDVHAEERIEVLPGGRVEGELDAPRVRLAEEAARPAEASEPLQPASAEASVAGEAAGREPEPADEPQGPAPGSLASTEAGRAEPSSELAAPPPSEPAAPPEPPPLAMPAVGRRRARGRHLGG